MVYLKHMFRVFSCSRSGLVSVGGKRERLLYEGRRAFQYMPHLADEFFHAYVVVPMWPEGIPTDGAVQEILAFQTETLQAVGGRMLVHPSWGTCTAAKSFTNCFHEWFIFVVPLAVAEFLVQKYYHPRITMYQYGASETVELGLELTTKLCCCNLKMANPISPFSDGQPYLPLPFPPAWTYAVRARV